MLSVLATCWLVVTYMTRKHPSHFWPAFSSNKGLPGDTVTASLSSSVLPSVVCDVHNTLSSSRWRRPLKTKTPFEWSVAFSSEGETNRRCPVTVDDVSNRVPLVWGANPSAFMWLDVIILLSFYLCLTVSPYSWTVFGAATGQLHGENLFLLRGGREGP